MSLINTFRDLYFNSGFHSISIEQIIMIIVSLILFYLAIKKKFEPMLLLPIAFGILIANLPLTGILDAPPPEDFTKGGFIWYISQGVKTGLYPSLVFLGIGAMTDFSPLIANPISLLLGGAAQVGIYIAFTLAICLGFSPEIAAAIAIIGGADGPTAIYLTNILAPEYLGSIAVAAYSYMALIPMIQPPIMRALTTKKERSVSMSQIREVRQIEKIIFPIAVSLICILFLPTVAPLVGMLMFGNLLKESGVVSRLSDVAQNSLINIVTILLGLSVGATANGKVFLTVETLSILAIGLLAFVFSTAGGLLIGKLMYKLSGGKINPLIGAAGVSAVPMAARVVQKVGREENPSNFLLMHAMGPNVSGVIGSAVAAGFLLEVLG